MISGLMVGANWTRLHRFAVRQDRGSTLGVAVYVTVNRVLLCLLEAKMIVKSVND